MIRTTFSRGLKKKSVFLKAEKDSQVLVLPSGEKAVSLGIGEKEKFNRRKFILACRQIIALAKANKIKKLFIDFSDFVFSQLKISDRDIAEVLVVNFEMANFEFVKYKTPPKEGWNLVKEIIVSGKDTKEIREGFRVGQIIAEEVNKCRALANTPGGEMTPGKLAVAAAKAVRGTRVKVKILSRAAMEKIKMGGVLGVARGSKEEPRFIVLEYQGGAGKPIVLVGKGVTFDTGGLNIKTGDYMYEMHMDMSGGAAVIHAIAAASRLKLKKHIVGLIPAVENMPSGESYRPGDILKSMSGKTIEVVNTDAEGRIILADALTYAKKYNPRLVVDVATLTGAAIVALGQRASAIFTPDEKLEKLCREIGEESGDYTWPLPLWEEYEEGIKGTFADVANATKSKYGGAIEGAVFLYQFAKDFPWIHIDMAPRMTAVEGEYLSKGAAGAPVRFLIKLLERF